MYAVHVGISVQTLQTKWRFLKDYFVLSCLKHPCVCVFAISYIKNIDVIRSVCLRFAKCPHSFFTTLYFLHCVMYKQAIVIYISVCFRSIFQQPPVPLIYLQVNRSSHLKEHLSIVLIYVYCFQCKLSNLLKVDINLQLITLKGNTVIFDS